MTGLFGQTNPKFVLLAMIVVLGFLLVLSISPGFHNRKAVDQALVAWTKNQTAENERTIWFEKEKAKRKQYLICGLAVLNVMAIAVYAGLQQRKRPS